MCESCEGMYRKSKKIQENQENPRKPRNINENQRNSKKIRLPAPSSQVGRYRLSPLLAWHLGSTEKSSNSKKVQENCKKCKEYAINVWNVQGNVKEIPKIRENPRKSKKSRSIKENQRKSKKIQENPKMRSRTLVHSSSSGYCFFLSAHSSWRAVAGAVAGQAAGREWLGKWHASFQARIFEPQPQGLRNKARWNARSD